MRKVALLLAAAVCWLAACAHAQYPVKPIRLVVPFAPGGPSDLLGRVVGQKLTEAWGQQVVIENRAGANGIVGVELVAKSPPDGYTLVMATNGTHGINAALFPKLPYHTINDFAPIARLGVASYVLVAHPSLPARSARTVIELAKARPGDIACGYGGSPTQLAFELFKSMAGIDLLLVPYKGNAPAVMAVLSGQVSLVFGGIAQSREQIAAGRLRAVGVTGMRRSPVLPQVPTINESGLQGFEAVTWYGMLAPGATPRAIVERLNSEIVRILQSPEVRQRFAAEAFEVPADTPDQFAAIIKGELERWAKVVKATGARGG